MTLKSKPESGSAAKYPRLGDCSYPVSLPSPPRCPLYHEQDSFSVVHDEDNESMLLVTACEPRKQCEGWLLTSGRREIDPPESATTEARKIILAGETTSRNGQKNVSFRQDWCRWQNMMKCPKTADQDPEVLSLIKNHQLSAPTVSTCDKTVTMQIIDGTG